MLSAEDNELITRIGPGTPMGETVRRYWVPALLSQELADPDGVPARVKLLGERLVAFRDTQGRVGLVAEKCAHRGASLFLGRNEEGGLRCIFHGWKYDVQGNCVDMPNEPPEFDFKEQVHLKVYPTLEMGGLVWAYMGPPTRQPPPPRFEWTQVPETHRYVNKVLQECNWLQALEGGIDTVHGSFLHRRIGGVGRGENDFGPQRDARAALLEVEETNYGYRYAGQRLLGDHGTFVRTYHYVMPFTQIRATRNGPDYAVGGRTSGQAKASIAGHVWVPMDDESTMVYNWYYSHGDPLTDDERTEPGSGNGPTEVDQTTFRSFRNRDNDWLQDRQRQKRETFTGIEGTNTQDRAAQESMDPVVDRRNEHLGQTDRAIIVARKLLLQAARTVQDGGDPPGADDSYYPVRAVERILPPGIRWQDALKDDMYAAPVR